MRKITTALFAITVSASAIAMTGCQTTNQGVGVISGGLAGALVGSRFGGGGGNMLATVGGALAGAFIGGKIGQSMDKAEANSALGAPAGEPHSWSQGSDTYTVTPTTQPKVHPGYGNQLCREYTTTASIGGKPSEVYGTACSKDGGETWEAKG